VCVQGRDQEVPERTCPPSSPSCALPTRKGAGPHTDGHAHTDPYTDGHAHTDPHRWACSHRPSQMGMLTQALTDGHAHTGPHRWACSHRPSQMGMHATSSRSALQSLQNIVLHSFYYFVCMSVLPACLCTSCVPALRGGGNPSCEC
jgi:hypothetical protein